MFLRSERCTVSRVINASKRMAVLTFLPLSEPGKGYNIFAGKDASKGLGMSSLKPEDAVSDYSTLDDKQMKVLDDWVRTPRRATLSSFSSHVSSFRSPTTPSATTL